MNVISDKQITGEGYRIINSIVNKYVKYNSIIFDRDELFSVGLEGLSKAILSFNKNKNNNFGAYAYRVIENHILMYVKKWNKIKRTPDVDKSYLQTVIYTNNDGNEISLEDTVEDSCIKNQMDNIRFKEELIVILKSVLNDNEYKSVYNKFIKYGDTMNSKSIAKDIGISSEKIDKYVYTARKKLKKSITFKEFFYDTCR